MKDYKTLWNREKLEKQETKKKVMCFWFGFACGIIPFIMYLFAKARQLID